MLFDSCCVWHVWYLSGVVMLDAVVVKWPLLSELRVEVSPFDIECDPGRDFAMIIEILPPWGEDVVDPPGMFWCCVTAGVVVGQSWLLLWCSLLV